MYLRDTLRLPAKGSAPLHTPFSSTRQHIFSFFSDADIHLAYPAQVSDASLDLVEDGEVFGST